MKTKLLIAVLALQSAWILGTTFTQERALRVGTVILLDTQPVDPRDLLAGDFIRLNYPISDVPGNLFSPPVQDRLSDGRLVYIALAKRGRFHEVVRASVEPFDPGPGQVVLEGMVRSSHWQPAAVRVHLEYGLERFYVPEGKGNPRGKLTVEAVVPPSGHAAIKEVFVDGKPYADAMKAQAAASRIPGN